MAQGYRICGFIGLGCESVGLKLKGVAVSLSGFPKSGDPFCRVPKIRIIVHWGLYIYGTPIS